jgi:hypothetical protein
MAREIGMSDAFSSDKATSAIPLIGALIRYSFYLIGSIVLAIVGMALLSHRGVDVKIPAAETAPAKSPADEKPDFRVADADLARMRQTGYVIHFKPTGRLDAWQYGQLTDRGPDFTIALFMAPDLMATAGDINQELAHLRRFNILRGVGPFGNGTFYDLHTRFGDVRATDMRANADGLIKQCLGFVSRFDTPFTHISGWYCTANGAKPDANALACMLDQFVLNAPLASPEADAFFRARAARPASCSAEPVAQTFDTRPFIPRRTVR